MFSLQEAVANTVYGSSIRLTPSNVYNYIKKWNIQTKTVAGKRGNNNLNLNKVVKVTRQEKMKNNPKTVELTNEVRKAMKGLCSDINPKKPGTHTFNSKQFTKLDKLCNKLEKGSLKAAICLTCYSCCAGDVNEIRGCEILDCPLYQFRPHKKKAD